MARLQHPFLQRILRAKYVCPECKRIAYYRCHLSASGICGRPEEHKCGCGALAEYRGFVSTYKDTVPYARGGRWELWCGDCGKATEHARFREGGLCMCLSCGRHRALGDEEERERQERLEALEVSKEDIWGPEK
jgi:hypothetical protein